jgi:agmatinase
MVKARDIDRIGTNGIIDNLKGRVGNTKVYISVDIDVLDPAFAPGKSNFHSFSTFSVSIDV